MRLQHVTITNMAGFSGTQEFDLPSITLIEGANGKGKTSLLDCLRYCFDSGHDDDLVHIGSDTGEIVITLDDGGAVRAQASRVDHTTRRAWRSPGDRKWNVSREFINKVAAAISYNAMAFVDLPDKEQVNTLLRLMPIAVDPQEIISAAGASVMEESRTALAPGINGLEQIDSVYDAIYDKRREYNVASDTQAKHASELERALPLAAGGDAADYGSSVKRLRELIARLDENERNVTATAGTKFQKVKDELTEERRLAEQDINSDVDGKIRALESERRTRLEEIRKIADEETEKARNEANRTLLDIRAKNAPIRPDLTAQLATAEERLLQNERTQGTRKAAVTAREESTAKAARAEVLTESLKALAGLRLKVAERLPIKGIKIKAGRLYNTTDVPFRRWNTVQQIVFALKLAVLAHGEAGFVLIDNAEHFDSTMKGAMLDACRKYAKDEGMQFLIGSVTDAKELQVKAG